MTEPPFTRLFSGKGKVQIASRGKSAFIRPLFAPFDVHIWTSEYENKSHMDVDIFAKACPDALNGVVWRDNRQGTRLFSEKF